MFNKGKLDVISFKYRTSTTKERELYYLSCNPRNRKFKNKKRTQKKLALNFQLTFRMITDQI